MRAEIERLRRAIEVDAAVEDYDFLTAEVNTLNKQKITQAIADLEGLLIPDGHITLNFIDAEFCANQLMQLSRNERGLMYTDMMASKLIAAIKDAGGSILTTQSPTDEATAEDIEGNDPDSCNDPEPLQETSTAECPECPGNPIERLHRAEWDIEKNGVTPERADELTTAFRLYFDHATGTGVASTEEVG